MTSGVHPTLGDPTLGGDFPIAPEPQRPYRTFQRRNDVEGSDQGDGAEQTEHMYRPNLRPGFLGLSADGTGDYHAKRVSYRRPMKCWDRMTDDETRIAGDGSPAPIYGQSQIDPLGPVSGEYAYSPTATETEALTGQGALTPTGKPTVGKSAARAVREIVETLLLALIIFVAVRSLVLNFRVDGNSMVPNLHDQEMLLVNRNVYLHFDLNKWLNYLPGDDRDGQHIIYPFHPPERGDIIVFNPPVASEKPYIKRVIAVAGDTVEVKQDGYVYINGEKLNEPYIQGPITECTARKCEAVTVEEGMVYVLGDNRRNSSDSRIFGAVDIDDIIGKAWLTYWPIDEFGLVPHYDYPGVPER